MGWGVPRLCPKNTYLPNNEFDLRRELYRLFGVDLTDVLGISAMTAQTILCEVGADVSRWVR